MAHPPRELVGIIVACLAVAGAVPGAARAAPADTIRTGGPSGAGEPKRAVVLSAERLAGKRFTVADVFGDVVLRGRLAKARGSARPWRHAALADLSALDEPGSYRVRVGGLTTRRRWVVLPTGEAASRVVRHVLRFFAVNADGSEPSPAHGPSHLNDATIRGGPLDGRRVDLTGGWMDAGDTLKFTQTTSFTVVALLLAARLDPGDAAGLREAADVGVRWLLKAHPAADVFVSQVGEITADHDRDPAAGFDPAADDRSPVPAIANRQALTGIGYDSGGRTAAALALAAQFEPDPGRRAQLLAAARAWYDAGERAGGLAPRLPQDPYPSSSGIDDMALAAVELHRASGEPQDLLDALDWLDGVEPAEPPNWDAVGVFAAAELCGAAGAPAPSRDARAVGCPFLRTAARAFARRARRHVLGTPGFLSFGTTATHAGAGAALALGSAAGFGSGQALAADARDWLLGRNPWGRSFIAGIGPGAPRRPHHWAVRKGAAAFRGAVVGGATTRATLREQELRYRAGRFDGPAGVYEDKVSNYVTSEAAIDYAASTVLLLAALASQEEE
jgi:endoglucanase